MDVPASQQCVYNINVTKIEAHVMLPDKGQYNWFVIVSNYSLLTPLCDGAIDLHCWDHCGPWVRIILLLLSTSFLA